jgi:antirestriction protein ArdC/DNA polymerase III epsilon subunit-like protein
MSRVVRRFGYAISPNGAQASTFKQAAYLREKVIEFIDSTNAEASTSRRLTRGAAFAVVHRSLVATKDLPFSIREHIAMKELSQYVTLLQNNKVAAIKPSHTDLLPVAHPRSTKMHTLTASALISARANWYADDSRITNEKVKSIVASAYTATPGSVEHSYYSAVLASLPQGSVPQDILVSLTADGNSSAERSLRARLQRRDRFGQFAEMGGGMSALIRMAKDGVIRKLTGRPVTDGPDGDDIQVELPDGRIVNIPASKGQFIPAVLERSKDGFSQTPAKVSVADNQYVINEEDLKFVDSPNGFEKVGENKWQGIDTMNAGMIVEKADDGSLNVEFEFMNGSRQDVGNFSDWEDVFDGIVAWDEDLKDRSEKADAKRKKDLEEDDKRRASLPKFDDEDIQVVELDKDGKAKGPARDAFPKKFAFNYPEGAYKISKDPDADIEESYEDPTQIAQYADERDLITALEEGLLPKKEGQNATGYGNINTYDGEQIVPVENLYLALQEMGGDPELEVARIYDKQLGTSENEDNLLGSRKQETISEPTPELDKAFIRETKELGPDIEPATEEPAFDAEKFDAAPLPALLEGLSETELARFMESEDHTPYLPKNEQVEMPIGYASLSPEPYAAWKKVTAENPDANLPEGFSDNPVFIAQNIPTPELEKEFRRALEPGNDIPGTAKISLKTDSGEEFVADVPGEAVRDALQLQGVDTNALTKKIADEGFEGQKQEVVGQEQPVAKIQSVKDAIRADEEYILKMRNFMGYDRNKALRDYKQQGPHDPLDPAYKDEFAKEFEEYLYEDGTPNGAFNDLLRSNPDFARLFAWNQFDQMGSPIHEEWRPSDEEVFEQFPNDNFEDVDHAYIDGLFDAAPTPATAITAALNVLMKPDYFYSSKKDKVAMLKDALRAFTDGDMLSDIKDDEQELAAVKSVTKSIEDEIARLQTAPATEKTGLDKPENKEALDRFNKEYVKELLQAEENLADEFEKEGMTRSDAQGAAAAEMKRIYRTTADEALMKLSSEEAKQVLDENEKRIKEQSSPATLDDLLDSDFEVSSEQEIPDGLEAEPKSPNLEPDNVTGPYRIVSKVSDLQPGDITADDHFVIESVGGPFEGDPSKLEISGYYPGHVTQNTKKWNASTEMTVIRGAQAPEKGDLPELSKPFARDFGPVYKNKEGKWSMSKAEDQAKLDAAWEEYNARKAEAIARFTDPTNKDNTKAPHQVRVKAADLQPGDVSAKPEKGHFVIERIFTDETTKPGKVSVEGYYPGHVSQRKEWNVGTDIDVIRNVEAPAKGELPEVHQPSKTNKNGNWVKDNDPVKRAEYEKEIADIASKWEVPKDLPTIEPSASDSDAADAATTKAVVVKKPKAPRTPTMPAFQGEFAAIAREAGGDWDKFFELLKDREIIFFDYETTGVDAADGNEPWQLGAVKVVNGKIVDRFNVFMNPGRSIVGTYSSKDKSGKPNAVDGEGKKLTDEFLASQPDQKSAHEQFAAWAGENPLLAAHNMIFDDEVARRMADKHGTPYSPAGLLDTLAIARQTTKDDPDAPTYPWDASVKDNRLEIIAPHFGIDLTRAHSADADSEATAQLLNILADKSKKDGTGADLFDVDARQADWEKAQTDFQTALADYEQKAADYATAKTIQDALAGKKVDLDKLITDAKTAPEPNPDGQQESDKGEEPSDPAIIDFESAGAYPQGKMKLMPREWASDDENTTLLPREDIRMKDLLPGDFMTSASGNHMYQIVAVRAGEDFGFQAGRVRAYRADLENGEIHMIEYWQNMRLDGVRRPKNPDDLLLPEDTTEDVVNDDVRDSDTSNEYVPVSTGSATVKVEPSEDGRYKMVATFFDDNGDVAYQVEDSYRTREGAEAEGKALIQEHVKSIADQQTKEQGQEATKQEDTPVSRGTVPTGADSAPQIIEVTDLPGGFKGDIQITPSAPDAKKPEYTTDASLVDSEGDVIDNQTTTHPSRTEAESTGRDFVSRSAEAYSSGEMPEGLEKKSSKPRKITQQELDDRESTRLSNQEVLEKSGLLPNTRADRLQVGDYVRWRGRSSGALYEEIIAIYPHPDNKKWLIFATRDPRTGIEYARRFRKSSPLTDPRRPGIEDQVEPEMNRRTGGPKESPTKQKRRGRAAKTSRFKERVVVDAARRLNPQARADAGLFLSRDKVAVDVGDVVVHTSEKMRIVHGVKARVISRAGDIKAGGIKRDNVQNLDYVWIEYDDEPGQQYLIQANNLMPLGPNGEIPKPIQGRKPVNNADKYFEPGSEPDYTEVRKTTENVKVVPKPEGETRLNQAMPSEDDLPEQKEVTKKTKFSDDEKKAWKEKKVEDIKQQLLDDIFADIENGVLPWEAKWKAMLGSLPFNPLTKKQYNGINLFILAYAQDRGGFSSNRWLGKKQASEMGGVLKDGAEPTDILLYQPGGPVFKKDADGKDTTEIAYFKKSSSSFLQVYNVDQFDNLILPEIPELVPVPMSEAEAEILKLYKDHPPIEFVQMSPGSVPHYNWENDKITLPERGQYGEDQAGFIKTLLHELSHSSGHKDRLDRSDLFEKILIETSISGDKAGPNRATEELMAEIAAAMIGAKLGLDLDTKHTAAYVQSWLRALRNDREMIFKAAGGASQILEYILEGKKPGSGVGKYGKTGKEIADENKE